MRYINGGPSMDAGGISGVHCAADAARGKLGISSVCAWCRNPMARRLVFAVCGRWGSVLNEVEIGWWLAQRCWGQGLATEAARSVMDFAFRSVGARTRDCDCEPENRASRRVMEKIGMHVRITATRAQGISRVLYAISGDSLVEWKAATRIMCAERARKSPAPTKRGGLHKLVCWAT